MKPLIAILPLVDIQRNSLWMIPGYMNGIIKAGGIPVMLPLTTDEKLLSEISNTYDGFLIPGGQDVNPLLYTDSPSDKVGEICESLDTETKTLLEKVLFLDKPILGICRGIQILNVLLGGTLYMDIPEEHPTETQHHMTPPYSRPIHNVTIIKDTPLFDIVKEECFGVNSYHHQAIKELAFDLKATALSEDNLIEGVYLPDKKFVHAVQWHPELSYENDEKSYLIFESFVKSCEKK